MDHCQNDQLAEFAEGHTGVDDHQARDTACRHGGEKGVNKSQRLTGGGKRQYEKKCARSDEDGQSQQGNPSRRLK